jgi:hypothetical protein
MVSGLSVSAQGALPMDCLPCDDDGKPLRPARDMNFYSWGGLLSGTGLPILLGDSIKLFPSHTAAYSTFWVVGGLIGIVAYLVLALLVHPQQEPPGLSCQCTRRWYRDDDDERRHCSRQENRSAAAAAAFGDHFSDDDDDDVGAGLGAMLCDKLLFPSTATVI